MILLRIKKTLYPILFILGSVLFCTNLYAQDEFEEDFEVYLSFRHRGVINTFVISYIRDDVFYLPVNEIFQSFQIESNINGLVIDGNFSQDQIPYIIDFDRQVVNFGDQRFVLEIDDFILKDFDFFLSTDKFNEFFGLDFSIDFNNLALNLTTIRELPIVERALRQQKRRVADENRFSNEFYPLRIDREKRFLNGGFLDYSLSSNVTTSGNSFNLNSAIGIQLAGGDLQGSIRGQFSQDYFSSSTNNLRWRYVVRDKPWLSDVTIGQSTLDGVLSNNYTGIRISNDPIETRRLFDEFEVEGNTFPQSEVELYLNNSLIDFQIADEFGNYRFLAPLSYGSTRLNLRIFGPTGQTIEETTRIQVPFSLLPKGEVNYKINAGILDNPLIGSTERNLAFQGNTALGLSSWLTAKVGLEYYEDNFATEDPSVTSTISARAFSNYIIMLEGATNGYYRTSIFGVFPSSASINLDYTNFIAESGIYNTSGYNEQIVTSLFYPIDFFGLPLNFRTSSFTRFRDESHFSTVRFDINSRLNKLSLRLAYSDRIIDTFNVFDFTTSASIEGSLSYSFSSGRNTRKLLRGTFLRTLVGYNPSLERVESAEFLVSKNILGTGRIQVTAGRNFIENFNSIRFNFVIDLNKVRSNTTFSYARDVYTSTQTINGSIGYDSNNRNLLFSSRDQVGKSASVVRFFVDNNGNGTYEEDSDDRVPRGLLRMGYSGVSSSDKDGLVYYTQMQSYYRYNMELNKSSIQNPMLVPEFDTFSIVTDPNTFKEIEIPFYMSGVIDGNVERIFANGLTDGVGGLKVILVSEERGINKEIRTYSDGSFYDYELPPANYQLFVDPSQLQILNVKSDPEIINFEVQALAEGDFVEGLSFSLIPLDTEVPDEETQQSNTITLAQVTEEIKSAPEVLEYSQEIFRNVDESLRLIINAQNAFYANNLDLAFSYVSKSLELFETAQAYALKGSFYYFEGNTEQAQRHWQMALRFNPDLFIPNMELLEERVSTSGSEE